MSRFWNLMVLLRNQLWFLPLLMSVGAVALAFLMTRFGSALVDESSAGRRWWLNSGDVATARDLLSTLLSGMITMTSLVVSVSFVVITLAAQQLGPRLITIFTSDRIMQAALGLFFGTIVYTLFVLRGLNETLDPAAVPHVAITLASVLVVACLIALLLYLHKVARSIVSDHVVAQVSKELRSTINDTLPSNLDDEAERDCAGNLVLLRHAGWLSVRRQGYVQTIDYQTLICAAQRAQVILKLAVRPGQFVLRHGRHVEVFGELADERALHSAIDSAVAIGAERSPAQDLDFFIRQLVETALRALSSGINDPFTANAVIDQLMSAAETIVARPLQPTAMRDEGGEVRVFANAPDPFGLILSGLDRVRQSGGDNPTVLGHLIDAIRDLAIGVLEALENDEQRRGSVIAALILQLEAIEETAANGVTVTHDRAALLERIKQVREHISSAAAGKERSARARS